MDDTILQLVKRRRVALDGADDGRRPWGLALSGGGIRSATFCLGLVKALARNGQLLRFDLVSTVSGGGYVGSALGRLFSDAKSSAEVRAVQAGLANVDEIRFGWWLRSNGRYLIPGGLRDTLFAVSLYLRNLLGTHIELAIAAALIGLGLAAFNLFVWWLGYTFVELRDGMKPLLPVRIATRLPTLYVLGVVPLVFSIVLANAYWAVRERPRKRRQWGLMAMWLAFGVLALWIGPMLERDYGGPAWLAPMFALFAATWVVALAWVVRHNDGPTGAARLRNKLTDRLTTTVWVALCIVLAGLLDRIAWWFAEPDRWAWRASAGAVLLTTAAALRAVMPVLFTNKRELPGPGKRVGLTLASVAGLLLIFLLAAWWIGVLYGAILIPVFTDDGLVFSRGWIWWGTLAVVLFGYALASGRNLDFLNVSSLHMFYKARIVRGYLGAANRERLGASPTDRISGLVPPRVPVGEVDAKDDIAHADYAPQRFGGPVHLINICINQTHAPNERLFNRDRKSLPLTVAPGGRVQSADEPWQVTRPEGALTLGAWAAISGAAFAPGMGRMTQRGVAALAMMAGLRLGYWWDSKAAGVVQRGAQPGRTSWLAKTKYLLHECFAMFPGSGAAHWYLSDGGHFENTAAYALLRQEAELIVIADCGADPDYRFEDIENLIRRARIDLQADIRFKKPCDQAGWPELRSFGSLSDIVSPSSQTCLALAEVSYASGLTGRIVLVKPNVSADLPVDLINFKAANPLFPQQPTTDQFFDEAQWESYFQLGHSIGIRLDGAALDHVAAGVKERFADDDGQPGKAAIATREDGGKSVLGVATARVQARVARAGAVTATIGLGTLATAGVALWQGLDGLRATAAADKLSERAALKDLTDRWARLYVTANRPEAAASLAAELLRTADALCPKDGDGLIGKYRLPGQLVIDADAACRAEAIGAPACRTLLDNGNGLECLRRVRPPPCIPRYWGRDYSGLAQPRENCTPSPTRVVEGGGTVVKPASIDAATGSAAIDPAAPVSPAPPLTAPAPARDACRDITVYVQIYGGEFRAAASGLREPWRALGASVPPIEDVLASARRAGRAPPTPTERPTLRYASPDALACARALSLAVPQPLAGVPGAPPDSSWAAPVMLDPRLKGRKNVIEAWLPRPVASAVPVPAPQAAAPR